MAARLTRHRCIGSPILLECARFLEAAQARPAQECAYYSLALDSGARRSELDGLVWADLDVDSGRLTIHRQLDRPGIEPQWGPTKTKKARTLVLTSETLAALQAHRMAQRELMMRNRTSYSDHGLIFTKQDEDVQRPADVVGQPLTTLGGRRYLGLVAEADLRRIKFHGLRHSCATLLLQAGVPPHIVAERLGHSVMVLLQTYAHALPSAQADAADRLANLLHGGRA